MDVELLISEVYKMSAIWNQSHPDHHNRYVLDRAWTRVAKQLNTTREAVRNKWKYLRDTFRKELAKIPKTRSGDSQDNSGRTSTWPYFKSLLFMKDLFTPRPLKGNLQLPDFDDETQSQATDDNTQTPHQDSIDNDEASENEDFNGASSEADFTDSLSTPSTSRSTSTSVITPSTNKRTASEISQEPRHTPINKRKRPNELIGQALLNIEQQKLDYIREKTSTPVLTDEDTQFFESLLPHVRKIKSEKKLLFRTQIQQLVQAYAYEDFLPQQPLQQQSHEQSNYNNSNNNNYLDTYTPL